MLVKHSRRELLPAGLVLLSQNIKINHHSASLGKYFYVALHCRMHKWGNITSEPRTLAVLPHTTITTLQFCIH